MIDGGLWANPVMNALVDALACYDVPRENVRILTIGTGDTAFTITRMRGWEAFGIGRFCALSPQRHARSPSTRWAKPFCLSERTMSFGSTRLKVRRQSGWTT